MSEGLNCCSWGRDVTDGQRAGWTTSRTGTELVLIGASPDVTRELGLSSHPRRETEQSADIFTMLGIERDLHPLEPLLTGEWKADGGRCLRGAQRRGQAARQVPRVAW